MALAKSPPGAEGQGGVTLTEDQTGAALAAFDAVGGLERWIAARPWIAPPVPDELPRV
jgi:hypothetical protein